MLLLVIAAAMPYRFESGIGPFSTFSVLEVVLLVGMPLVYIAAIQNGRLNLGNWRVFLCISVPLALGFFSLLWSDDVDATLKYLVKIATAFIIYIVVVNSAANFPEKVIRKYWLLFFALCLLGTIGFFLNIPGFQLLELRDTNDLHMIASAHMRLTNPFIGRAPDYGPILAFGVFLMLAYSIIYRQRLYFMFSFLLILCVLLTFTRGILLGFFIGLLYFGIVLKVGFLQMLKNIAKVLIVLIPLLLVVISNYNLELDDRTIELSQVVFEDRVSNKNIDSRFELYGIVIDKISESPLLGHGAGVFNISDSGGETIAAHNSYLQGFLFYGIFFGLIYSFVLLYHFYAFYKIPVRSRQGKILSVALSSGIITMLVTAMSQPFMEASVPRVLLAFIMGLGVLSIKAIDKNAGFNSNA